MGYILRTRIKKEIITEFLPPARKSNKVIILCSGMPGYPSNKALMLFLSRKGFWVFSPRYRGSWESGGSFLEKSPHIDALDIINSLSSCFTDLYNNKQYKIKNPIIYLIGSSFGGAAAILASSNKKVRKAVALSPVTDWRVETKLEPIDWLRKYSIKAFGNAYRFNKRNWNKLKSGKFYNPINEVKKLDKDKIYIIHSKDDKVVPVKTSLKFVKELGCKLTLLKKGGHLGSSSIIKPSFWKRINSFLNKKAATMDGNR